VHEIRFEVQHDTGSTTPRTNGITINVLDAFNSGGGQNFSNNNNWGYEFGNLVLFSSTKWTMKTGIQINRSNNHTESRSNYQGTYQFSSLADYIAGRPTLFTRTSGNPILDSRQTEFGTFMQNDWKVTPKFTFSAGVRYQAQTNLKDYNNIDPRIGFALGLTKTSLIRGGAGIFHQTFSLGNTETLLRADGTRQLQVVVSNPTFDPLASGSSCSGSDHDPGQGFRPGCSVQHQHFVVVGKVVAARFWYHVLVGYNSRYSLAPKPEPQCSVSGYGSVR